MTSNLQTQARDSVEFTESDGVRCRMAAGDPQPHSQLTRVRGQSEAVMDIEHIPLPAASGLGQDEDVDDTVQSHGARRKQGER